MTDKSTPTRFKTNAGLTIGGWAYENEEQTRFAFRSSLMGFGMPSFDDFIDGLPDGIGKQELLDWRQQAFEAFKSGNQLALKGWLQAAYTNWKARLTVDGIREPLSYGLKMMGGPKVNKAKADPRHDFLIKEYLDFIAIGLDDKTAREKANDELRDNDELCLIDKKTGKRKGYKRTQLNKIIDKYLSKK